KAPGKSGAPLKAPGKSGGAPQGRRGKRSAVSAVVVGVIVVGVIVVRAVPMGVSGVRSWIWILPVDMLATVRGVAEVVGGGPVVVGVVAALGPRVEVHAHLRDPFDVVEDGVPHVLTDVVGLVQRQVLVERDVQVDQERPSG